MEIYRVTIERTFTDEIIQSHFFSTKKAALGYAEMLKEELDADAPATMLDIVVAAYTPDDDDEFFYDHDIASFEV